jgi:hypothetical protein
MNDIYKEKYLIYKKKYINLKKKYIIEDEVNQLNNLVKDIYPFIEFIDKYINIIRLLAKAGSISATVLSLGFGGDTIVEFSITILNFLRIAKSYMDIFNLLNQHKMFYHIIVDLLNTEFKGIDFLDKDYESINNQVKELNNVDDFIDKLCNPLQELLEKISTLAGDIISSGIPNDNFIASSIIRKLILDAIEDRNNVILVINKITNNYNKIPESFKNILENEDELANLIYKIFNFIKKTHIFGNKYSYNNMEGGFLIPTPLSIAKRLIGSDTQFHSFIDIIIKYRFLIAKIINKSIGLLFMILFFMRDFCL